MGRFLKIVSGLGLLAGLAYIARELLTERRHDAVENETWSSERVVAAITPMPPIERADPNDPPHKAPVDPKKAEAPKPAARKANKAAAETKKAAKKSPAAKKAAKKPPPPEAG